MAKAGELDWSEFLCKAPAPIEDYSADVNVPNVDKEKGFIYNKNKTKTLPNGLEYRNFSTGGLGGNKQAMAHALYDPKTKEILAILKTATEHDYTDSGDKIKHSNAVYDSSVNPKYKGKGLGKQLYLATLLHHGDLSSDVSLSPRGHDAWKHLKSIPGLNVRLSPYNEDGAMTRHRAKVADINAIDYDKAFPKFDEAPPRKPTNEEITKAIMYGTDAKGIRQATDEELFGHLIVSKEQASNAQKEWDNKFNAFYEAAAAPINGGDTAIEWNGREPLTKGMSEKELARWRMYTKE